MTGNRNVEIVHWNPKRRLWGSRLRSPFRVNNFGDLIGPLVVDLVAERLSLSKQSRASARLLTVGSIMHMARPGDVIWGSGVNGKVPIERHSFDGLDVRAVRGPLTARALRDHGLHVPEIYGDPALLLPELMPSLRRWAQVKIHDTIVIPNLNDLDAYESLAANVLDPRTPLLTCLKTIAQSRSVVGSSLHGFIVSESLGIPARLVASPNEPEFKYQDYFLGTGREPIRSALTLDEAFATLPEHPAALNWEASELLDAFPGDLWSSINEK